MLQIYVVYGYGEMNLLSHDLRHWGVAALVTARRWSQPEVPGYGVIVKASTLPPVPWSSLVYPWMLMHCQHKGGHNFDGFDGSAFHRRIVQFCQRDMNGQRFPRTKERCCPTATPQQTHTETYGNSMLNSSKATATAKTFTYSRDLWDLVGEGDLLHGQCHYE